MLDDRPAMEARILNDSLLAEKLGKLVDAGPVEDDLIEVLGAFIRSASDDELVRINPYASGSSTASRPDEWSCCFFTGGSMACSRWSGSTCVRRVVRSSSGSRR